MSINTQHLPSCIEINPSSPPIASVIWLHGLGADGEDFVSLIPELKLPVSLPIRFIFPNAPVMPVTINQGYEMRAWYDIYGVGIADKIDEAGIANSITLVENLIAKEASRGIPSQRIFLAGFSQGAVIALATNLHYAKPLAGVIALSGYLPIDGKPIHLNPIFMAHGTEDNVVPYALGKACYMRLEQAGFPVEWHSYAMPHSVCMEEIDDISRFIQSIKYE